MKTLKKKQTSKVAYLGHFFFLCSLDCPKQPRTEYPFYRFLYPMIRGTVSGVWTDPIVWSIPAKKMLDWNHVNLDMPMKNISWGVFIDGNSLEFTICDIQHKLCVR